MLVNGTTYKDGTPAEVVNILERFRQTRLIHRRGTRIRIYYGDKTTGRAWGDTEAGYIGRSMGAGPYPQLVPLMLPNVTSSGGGAILTDCIVRIEYANKRDGDILWRHPTYHEVTDTPVYITR